MNSNQRLKNKVAIVTGGASGIGEATVRLFVENGAKVGIADIDNERGMNLEKELNSGSETVFFKFLDVSSENDWESFTEEIIKKWGKLDILVNNAGLSGPKGRAVVEETTLDNWNDVFAINSTGVMLGTRSVIKYMKISGSGSIVNVSSIFGIVGSKAGAAYHASKGSARIFSKAAAVQYATDKIRVNSVHPGFTDTPMTLDIHSDSEIREYRENMTPLGRLGNPEDIAYGILYLSSDESSWVTGTELVIDGGETCW